MSRFAVIFPAAGKSSRFSGREKKPFALLDGRAVWLRTVELFVTREDVCQCILIIAPEDRDTFRTKFGANIAFMDVQIAEGGSERFESIANALKLLKSDAEFVAVHDAVRPCLDPECIDGLFQRAVATGAAMLAVPITDTIKKVDAQKQIEQTVPRENLWLAQTPQVFRRDWLLEAYENRVKLGKGITDDAQLVEAAGHKVHVVESSLSNIKITTHGDILLAKAILAHRPPPKVKGPIHPFAEEDMWK